MIECVPTTLVSSLSHEAHPGLQTQQASRMGTCHLQHGSRQLLLLLFSREARSQVVEFTWICPDSWEFDHWLHRDGKAFAVTFRVHECKAPFIPYSQLLTSAKAWSCIYTTSYPLPSKMVDVRVAMRWTVVNYLSAVPLLLLVHAFLSSYM